MGVVTQDQRALVTLVHDDRAALVGAHQHMRASREAMQADDEDGRDANIMLVVV